MDKEIIISYIEDTIRNLRFGNITSVKPINNNLQPPKKRFLASTKDRKYLFKFYDGVIRENLEFLHYLNSVDFPTQRIYVPQRFPPIPNNRCVVYEYLEGVMKNNISFGETLDVARLIARLHEESDNYFGKCKGKEGLTHGDLKLQNIIFVGGHPNLIDFERMKERPYVADVTGYLFYNTLSDLSNKFIIPEDAVRRANLFRTVYEKIRGIDLDKRDFSQYLKKHSDWFVNWVDKEIGERPNGKPSLKQKRGDVGETLEVLLTWY